MLRKTRRTWQQLRQVQGPPKSPIWRSPALAQLLLCPSRMQASAPQHVRLRCNMSPSQVQATNWSYATLCTIIASLCPRVALASPSRRRKPLCPYGTVLLSDSRQQTVGRRQHTAVVTDSDSPTWAHDMDTIVVPSADLELVIEVGVCVLCGVAQACGVLPVRCRQWASVRCVGQTWRFLLRAQLLVIQAQAPRRRPSSGCCGRGGSPTGSVRGSVLQNREGRRTPHCVGHRRRGICWPVHSPHGLLAA